jgi:hypothetical protein
MGMKSVRNFRWLTMALQLPHVERVVEETVVGVPLVDDAAPRRPAPDAEHGGEEIVVRHVARDLLAVESGYHRDAVVVFIAVEQLLAEGEERLRGHVVVFEDDTFVGHGESPLLRDIFRRVAAVVLFLVEPVYVAFPVDVLHDFPAAFYAGSVPVSPRSVLIEEEARRACFPHLVEYFLEVCRPVEEQDEHGNINLSRLFHRY